jgi:hypothetical protein
MSSIIVQFGAIGPFILFFFSFSKKITANIIFFKDFIIFFKSYFNYMILTVSLMEYFELV